MIQGLLVFNGFVASLELEDSDEEDTESEDDDVDGAPKKNNKKGGKDAKEEFQLPSIDQFGAACLTSFSKSMSILTCVRSLEETSLRLFRPRFVNKLVKDTSKSAMRKYMRTHSRFAAASLMLQTGMRANFLGHFAIFIVEEAHQIILILYRRYKSNRKALRGSTKENEEKEEGSEPSFLAITLKNATRSSLAVVTGGLGAAVGTLVRPGFGTMVGAMLGDTVAYLI
ncbi:hypothetical protein ATCC90586_003165 [Pythium insidiosum]|nr:hypothetical protein ATCC90586_003165 [Pythium insidiosum]